MPTTAGSDAHCIEMLGNGITVTEGSDVLKAIQKGRTSLIKNYVSMKVLMDWAVSRLKLSSVYIINYMNTNYSWPKRAVCGQLLSLVDKSPGNIDYLFKMMAYFSYGSVIAYSATREILGVR